MRKLIGMAAARFRSRCRLDWISLICYLYFLSTSTSSSRHLLLVEHVSPHAHHSNPVCIRAEARNHHSPQRFAPWSPTVLLPASPNHSSGPVSHSSPWKIQIRLRKLWLCGRSSCRPMNKWHPRQRCSPSSTISLGFFRQIEDGRPTRLEHWWLVGISVLSQIKYRAATLLGQKRCQRRRYSPLELTMASWCFEIRGCGGVDVASGEAW